MNDSVKLNIISGFDPKGITAAKAGMADVSRFAAQSSTANKAAAVAGTVAVTQAAAAGRSVSSMRGGVAAAAALASALGQGGGSVAAGARVAGAGLTAFASGPVAITIAACVAAVSVYSFFRKKLEETNKASRESFDKASSAMKKHFTAMQETRLDNLVNEYKRIREELSAGLRISEAFAASLQRVDSTRAKITEARYKGEAMTREAAASSPADKQRVKMQADVEAQTRAADAAKAEAQQSENDVRRKLKAAQDQAAASANILSSLRFEYTRSQNKAKVGKEIEEAEKDVRDAVAAVAVEQQNLLAASEGVTLAVEQGRLAVTEASQRLVDFNRAQDLAIAAALESAANESLIAGLTADQVTAQRELNKAVDRQARAAARADAAGNVPLNKWVENQRADNQGKKDAADAEMDFRENVAKLQAKQARGIRISREGQETLDLLAQRQRLMQAGAGQKPEDKIIDRLDSQIKALDLINKNLQKNLIPG